MVALTPADPIDGNRAERVADQMDNNVNVPDNDEGEGL